MKNLILILLFLVGWSTTSFSQTYYNPSNKVDFTITIKESYKPVDYSKIGRDFNTMIQNELQRRENLKRYYDEIYYQTKNSVYSSTVLTSDNLVNSKILMIQQEVIEYLDVYNRLLKSGSMKPEEYESNVRNIYYTYMNSNQVFLQIVQYKYNKDLQLGDQIKINEHNNLYTNTLNSIEEFRFNNTGEIEFVLNGLIYPSTTTSSFYDFVRSSSEGRFEEYKLNYKNNQLEILNENNRQRDIITEFYKTRDEILDMRRNKLLLLKKSNKVSKIRKLEIKYYLDVLEVRKKSGKDQWVPKRVVKHWFKESNNDFIVLRETENYSFGTTLISMIKDFWDSVEID